ncbi:acVLRF1 family peptidyl-tRNA hydrolase [Amycolatopsis sp. QT-25]|uniref:acVLRF1 family peptidyl-tRNA hydrolase n=1 Tax=Amycolatopsis sp. QT-25 TaxID=3034022 RepID=UPI0023EDE914|nr:acVLRF1 family peptidyl-tRNA hydrolase [Amycolatopsis sp. QT-25]WET82208.1 acVLRF1 family peptidyl-tRNA hydrolase [Amycolatopsis sp. QT-25]
MAKERQVAGGGRAVEVAPDRLEGWYARFAVRNDGVRSTELAADTVTVTADNGVVAVASVPFEPLNAEGTVPGLAVGPLIGHALLSRRIALLLVRRGGHSVGIARGGVVVQSRTDRHRVQGRSAAGGWSQQRFARRREGQARTALRSAAEDAFDVLVPQLSRVDAVVLGGDRRALETLREDRRLAPLFQRAERRVLDIAEPRRTVLEDAAERAVAVEITLSGP